MIRSQTGASQTGYQYDGDGIRVQSAADGIVTNYLVDKARDFAQVVEETDGPGTLIVSYVYGDDLISQNRSGSLSYYHYDGLGSTRALTNNGEEISDTYIYAAFGELTDTTGTTDNNYLFTGEQHDPNVGFYYLRSRYHNPAIGRFTSMDVFPGIVSDPMSLHKYVYGENDPVNNVDPSGQFVGGISEAMMVVTIVSVLHAVARPAYGARMRFLEMPLRVFRVAGKFKYLNVLDGEWKQSSIDKKILGHAAKIMKKFKIILKWEWAGTISPKSKKARLNKDTTVAEARSWFGSRKTGPAKVYFIIQNVARGMSYQNVILIDYVATAGKPGLILAHELGHCLGLSPNDNHFKKKGNLMATGNSIGENVEPWQVRKARFWGKIWKRFK